MQEETKSVSNFEVTSVENEVEIPAETFEDLFQIARENAEAEEVKECDVMMEAESKDCSDEVFENTEVKENVKKDTETSETENVQENEEEPQIRGNYSKASADKIWKDLK